MEYQQILENIYQAILPYAKECGVEMITGHLSAVDNDHKERRDHYYEKFGFDVKEKNIINKEELHEIYF